MQYLILWSDNDAEAHARLLEGTEEEADAALEMMRKKYAEGDGFRHWRIIDYVSFVPLAVFEDEYREYLRLQAESDADQE